jgi:PTS system nitrogen regulatory IIA component
MINTSLLTPGRTCCRVPGSSKKRTFEFIADTISLEGQLASDDIFSNLITRERLGSTGFGNGIAIPHSRMSACKKITGCLITLAEPIDYDAPDDIPVDILFALLVPEDEQQAHLNILGALAELLNDENNRQRLRNCQSDTELFNTFTELFKLPN